MIIRWELILGLILISISIAIAKKNEKTETVSKCPMLTECPFRAEPCDEDDDCSLNAICCKSPCGKVCTKQLFTGCQTLRVAASRRAKALGVDAKQISMPRCNKVGGFEPIQCDNEIVSSCWCVDEAGFELAGTRAPAAALVNCTAPKPCADHTCRMFCPHGFSLSKDGCPLCRCRDPCDDVRCPNSLECHLEDLACADPPCPPVPTCKRGRSLDNICPVGDPLRISDSVRPFLCGTDPGKPQCPPLYQCLVQKGNDYGVCCPASLKIQKTGACPAAIEKMYECSAKCSHDLECPSVQKCCQTQQCGSSCIHPENVTECLHQRTLAEILAVSERAGRGYVPQCSSEGQFEPKQCSRNELVCWCVDRLGRKLKGSMGPAENVNCSHIEDRLESAGRSLDKNRRECEQMECAQVCEYGFKLDEDGCHTCKCDDPCDGYMCPEDEECVNVKEASCTDFLCPSLPVCRPKAVYANPCGRGTPLTDDLSGAPVACALRSEDGTLCPTTYECTAVPGSTQAVCCPRTEEELEVASSEDDSQVDMRPQTMCEYLHEFSDNMEGTRDGMTLALPTPNCDPDGNYIATQCSNGECWCVDHFGTEIPRTRGKGNSSKNCVELRETLDCLDLTCRMGCEYGFILSEETGCPLCQCRDPCSSVSCNEDEQCQLVEVSCKDHYCPPVPSCLPKKVGQCPYLVPATATSCDFECNSDIACNGTMRCCSNGCGTQCTEPLLLTACQHQRKVAQYHSHESDVPAGSVYIPNCKEDGSYEPKQCNLGTGECWCVNFLGHEVSDTRTKSHDDLSCDPTPRSNRCPLIKCAANCEHGYQLNEKGCRTCKCIDPCSQISCRGEGEACRLVSVECVVSWPCPSVPLCLPKKENPCQSGEPLRLGTSDELVTCGPDFESCPSSHKCQLSPLGEYAVCCPKPPLPKKIGQCPYLIPPTTTSCDFECNSDMACNGTKKCCSNGCGTQCTEPLLLTACQHQRNVAEHYALESGLPAEKVYIPKCKKDGSYEPKQCDPQTDECWCVDFLGSELSETRNKSQKPLSCDPPPKSDNCPLHKCKSNCDHGFELNEQGCRTCICIDPCSQMSCRGEEETCRLVSVECAPTWPCPPMPMCLPKKENSCQNGEPLKLEGSNEVVTCGPSLESCPSSHKCELVPVGEYAVCCPKPPLPKKIGQCPYLIPATSTSCDFECNSDIACNGTKKCCSNGCGTQCTEPLLLTACQHQRTLAQHQAHESGIPAGKVYIPKCKEDGSYEPKQCNPGTGECWCSDFRGFEVSDTHTKSHEALSCDPQPLSYKCPLLNCVTDCEHGFELNEQGCRTCSCIDPCSQISCRGEGETCRLVSVECLVSWPCPTVPMCLPKKENPCQSGEPLRLGSGGKLVTCGPDAGNCLSSHKCQLSPVGEYAVCCPKPRDVCFEPLDKGKCQNDEDLRNLTRYYFNSRTNKCEQFTYTGCQGNHNNFHSEDMCNVVCPVLSQCERLREKNQRAAERYKKPTFTPRCEPTTGAWQAVQCLEYVGVCWCVTPQGEPLKGTLTRGAEPQCNFRQARNRANDRSDYVNEADLVLEELMMQIGSFDDEDEPEDLKAEDNALMNWEIPASSRCEAFDGQCDKEGKFLPTQCEGETCWCVDEAGNQLPNTNTFMKGERFCAVTPIEKAEVTLGFRGEFDDVTAEPVVNQVTKFVKSLNGHISSDGIKAEATSDALYIKFSLIGGNKVDVAYKLEQMVMQQRLPSLTADITRSRVVHKLLLHDPSNLERIAALEQREIVSQSPVSVVAPYHTALIVTAAASCFIICILTLLVLLYRRKMNSFGTEKVLEDTRFMSTANRPIYIELPNEKYSSLSPDLNGRKT